MRRRLDAALDQGARRVWVDAPRVGHDALLDDVRERFGSGLVRVTGDDLPQVDEGCDVVVTTEQPLGDDATRRLLAAAPRTVVVLSPPRWSRAGSPLLDAVLADGVVLGDEPTDGGELEAWTAAAIRLDAASTEQVLARAADIDAWVEAIVADLETIEVEDPGSAARVAGDHRGRHVETLVRDTARRIGPDDLGLLEGRAADPDSTVDPAALDRLADEGLVRPDGAAVPVVAETILAGLPPGRRSELASDAVDRAGELGAVAAARILDRLAATSPPATAVRVAAAAEIVAHDAALALRWLDDVDGHDEIRLRALVGCGRMADALSVADRLGDAGEAPFVAAAALAHGARLRASADAYADIDDGVAPVLAGVPVALLATPADAAPAGAGTVGRASTAYSRAMNATIDHPADALTDLVEATELSLDTGIDLWPDSPPLNAALVASALLRHDHAFELVDQADRAASGGPVFRSRRILVRGWIALRSGQWTSAADQVAAVADVDLSLRDRLLAAGLAVALAHRQGEGADLEQSVGTAVPLVRRHPLDLASLFAHAEIALGAARLGHHEQAGALLDQMGGFIDACGGEWRELVTWQRHTARLATDLALAAPPASESTAGAYAEASALAVDPNGVDTADLDRVGRRLLDAGQVLEAALLAGAVALAATDDTTGKAALRLAREFRARLPRGIADESSGIGALSDREIEVARELIAGFTYKEIGGRLFISPKTVEHHVAHIRTKLGAGSRAEMLSALRTGLD